MTTSHNATSPPQRWAHRPELPVTGVSILISGVFCILLVGFGDTKGLGRRCSWSNLLFAKLVAFLVLAAITRFEWAKRAMSRGAIFGFKWGASALQRTARSSTNLRNTLSSSDALSRLSKVSSSVSLSICNTFKSYRRRSALKSITRKECFAKIQYVERLSIHDLVILFRYANDVNQTDFRKKDFMIDNSQLVRSMITAMDVAVTMSRGAQSQDKKAKEHGRKGEIDALYFTAVVRIFAEWRTLRLIPPGCGGRYAAGLNMAYRDILQNLAKIEAGTHEYLKYCSQSSMEDGFLCPTLRDVVEFEKSKGKHPLLPKLTEKSTASGLLWTNRQIDYQTTVFHNTLQVPESFATTEIAVKAAYSKIFGQFHGWALKQLFSQSFGGSPPLEDILKQMDPYPSRSTFYCQGGTPKKSSDISESRDDFDNEFLEAVDDFGKFVGEKWEDLLRFFNCVDNRDRSNNPQNIFVSSESYPDINQMHIAAHMSTLSESLSEDSDETPAPSDPLHDVKSGLLQFVSEIRPLLEDISGLLDEFNMNDPSKV